MRAFVRGGRPGVEVLSRVWLSILKAYSVDQRFFASVMWCAGVEFRFGGLRVIGHTDDDEAVDVVE